MAQINNFEIFDGKNFNDLCKEIHSNQSNRKDQIDIFISDLRPLIKTANDALQIAPLIKQYIDAGICNDEHLIKLAQICQKIMTQSSSETKEFSITEEEKKELMEQIDQINKSDSIIIKSISK